MSERKRVVLGRRVWTERVEQWKASGLAASVWCRKNNICYMLFIKWKNRLNTNPQAKSASNFIELKEKPANNGITLECEGVKILLSDQFNPEVLVRCIKTLKNHLC